MCVLSVAVAQTNDPLLPGVIYVCSGERMFIENCNIRDTSDNATCMVGHPDHVLANGIMQYTYVTKGALKKLFPTCTQPSAKQAAAAQAFQKRQQDTYNANAQKANDQLNAIQQQQAQSGGGYGQPAPPKNAEERAMRRCVSSGRLPATCTGNSLLGAFGQMLSQVLPGANKEPTPGPDMAGVFEGPGHWRLDFIDGGVLVNCSFLSPNQEAYSLDFKGGHAVLTINTRPRPLVLTLHGTETITGPPGPVTIDGVVAGGYTPGSSSPGHTETSQTTTHEIVDKSQTGNYGQSQLTYQGNNQYDAATTHTSSTYVAGASTPGYTNFVPKRATCPAINLSSKGAGTGIQTMQTDLLKTAFGGEKGPPTPPGIRMHGIFAASTGFSVQFFPESAILGCGPDAARAYPYTVEPGATGVAIKIAAPDHPLALTIKPDGSLDPGDTNPYQVHGRIVTGQDNNDNFTFAPLEQSCNLATLTPSKTIPSSGGGATTMLASAGNPTASAGNPAATPSNSGGALSSSAAPLGNATLSIVSGLPPQPDVPNPLAGHPYTLLRNSVADILAKQGIAVPQGSNPYKVLGIACGNHTPDCQKILDAVKANAASAIRADANGSGTFPGVSPGTYYLMISARYNNQALVWDHPIQLKPGPNTLSLDQRNATPIN
ncbi:hypothetical protein HDF12_002364 [Edaphobacter lichenicola]|uniref:Uncharacterized protein n=1 Tax=Tunturiibacter lichenicola TaxID=2051959 RepID=A0A7Y9NMA0_9BACT|nr:hypothetical protein [Edaphobacter lichenicola]